MTRQEQRKLREIIAENRAYYRRQLQGTEPCRWDCCVLTASTTRQARGYELEIAHRQRAGWLPPEPRYLVVPDLGGRRIGSAGAACYALRRVMQHWAEQGTSLWEEARILLINSGGDSKRMPHCSVFGKVFANLPFRLFHGGPQSTVFDELMVPKYRRITEYLKKRFGITVNVLDCDGQIYELVPGWLACGINCMFPIESAHTDPLYLREKYGHQLLLIGGVDKKALICGKDAIDREIERLAPLVEDGGYIPTVDHRVPPDVSFENYCYYLEKKKEIL